MDDPLDFEKEDQLLATPRSTTKRRKVIGLDDLLTDYYTERSKLIGRKSKSSLKSKNYDSDEEGDMTQNNRERMLSEFVDDCQKQVNVMTSEDEIPLWGQKIFGSQRPLPSSRFTGLGNCQLLQCSVRNELNAILDLNDEQGETFLEGLLRNGWLSKLAFICGFVDDSIASWTFNTMLYSSNEELQVSACEFWCGILLSKNESDQPLVRLGWLPSYSQLTEALEIYGYLSDTSNGSPISKELHEGY